MQTHREADLARRLQRKSVVAFSASLASVILLTEWTATLEQWGPLWWLAVVTRGVLLVAMVAAVSDWWFARKVLRRWREGWVSSQGWRPRG